MRSTSFFYWYNCEQIVNIVILSTFFDESIELYNILCYTYLDMGARASFIALSYRFRIFLAFHIELIGFL